MTSVTTHNPCRSVGLLVLCFTAYQPFSGHLTPNYTILIKNFQTIQLSISTLFVYMQLNLKTIVFQTIQFSISINFCLLTVKRRNCYEDH